MHDVLRQRILRRLETLPEAQMYQVLDYIEFLESKYAQRSEVEPGMLQKFAEGLEDKMRKRAMNPATLREAFQLISAADRVLADVSTAGKQILDELGGLAEPPSKPRRVDGGRGAGTGGPGTPRRAAPPPTGSREPSPSPSTGRPGPSREPRGDSATPPAPDSEPSPDEVALGEEWTVREPGRTEP